MRKSVLVAVKRSKAFPKYRVTLEKARKFMVSLPLPSDDRFHSLLPSHQRTNISGARALEQGNFLASTATVFKWTSPARLLTHCLVHQAHDESESCGIGDLVKIRSCR